MSFWRYYLKDAVLNGGVPFNKAHGNVVYEQIGTDVRFNKVFNKGMSDHSAIIIKRMLEIYKGFEGVSTLIDVGGGTGATLHTIVSKYPTIKGINYELPHVIEDAPAYEGILFSFLYLVLSKDLQKLLWETVFSNDVLDVWAKIAQLIQIKRENKNASFLFWGRTKTIFHES